MLQYLNKINWNTFFLPWQHMFSVTTYVSLSWIFRQILNLSLEIVPVTSVTYMIKLFIQSNAWCVVISGLWFCEVLIQVCLQISDGLHYLTSSFPLKEHQFPVCCFSAWKNSNEVWIKNNTFFVTLKLIKRMVEIRAAEGKPIAFHRRFLSSCP